MRNLKILIVLSAFIAILFLSSCQQLQLVKEKCVDECSEDSCNGFEYVSCLTSEDGCKDKINEGLLKGKCNIECVSKLDCEAGFVCSSDYKCKAPEPVCGNGIQEKEENCLTCPADVECMVVGCGDGSKSASENCGNCPDDAGCASEETCIDNKCVTTGYFKGEGPSTERWCQWRPTKSKTPNLPPSEFGRSYSNCPFGDTSSKLVDGMIKDLDAAWYCKPKVGNLKFPVEAAVELKKLTNVNNVQVVQSAVTDDWNAQNVDVLVSADSTDGKNGHWKKVASAELPNSYSKNKDIQFVPISAKWVKLSVAKAWGNSKFGLAEMKVYESEIYCEKPGPGL